MNFNEKLIVFEKVKELLDGKLKVLVESAFLAKEASTNEESKAENKYDTRGLEASYLAAGQAKRAQDLQEMIYKTSKTALREFSSSEPISVSALVEVEVGGAIKKWFFILPSGGIELDHKGQTIQTITLDSPVGKSLHNAILGDDFILNGKEYEILQVV